MKLTGEAEPFVLYCGSLQPLFGGELIEVRNDLARANSQNAIGLERHARIRVNHCVFLSPNSTVKLCAPRVLVDPRSYVQRRNCFGYPKRRTATLFTTIYSPLLCN